MCSIGRNKSYTNRTKKDKTMDQLLERRGDEYSDKQKETMWKVDAAARKDYNAKLAAAYYTSPRFAKDLTLAAANVGLRMGVRQALGFAFAEMWFAVEEEFQACDAKDGHLIWAISLDGLAVASSVDLKMQSRSFRTCFPNFLVAQQPESWPASPPLCAISFLPLRRMLCG